MASLSKQPYPGLEVDGWITTPAAIADRLLSDFFLSEYAQTENFTGGVLSFPWLIKEYQDNLDGLTQALQDGLVTYFERYFWNPEVAVQWRDEENSINRQVVIIFLVFYDSQGEQYNIARIAKSDGNKIREIIAVVNDGEGEAP